MKFYRLTVLGVLGFPVVLLANFTDVPENHSFQNQIQYVQEKGIVSGYEDGTFRPEKSINRAELTKVITEALFDDNSFNTCPKSEIPFPDIDLSAWYTPYLCVAQKESIINGYPDQTFKPANTLNFAEAAKIIGKSFRSSLSDGTDVWYQPYIEYLERVQALPPDFETPDQSLNRGQAAFMIAQLHQNLNPTPKETNYQSATSDQNTETETEKNPEENASSETSTTNNTSNALYLEISPEALQEYIGKRKIALFFHADWCPTCVQADKMITEQIETFPEDTVVFKTNFDTEVKLRQKFGITQQHSIVIINTKNEAEEILKYGFTIEELKSALEK